jgi:OHCU decarboxylase
VSDIDALSRLNSSQPDDAKAELLKCCGSTDWAEQTAAQLPYKNLDELIAASNRVWWSLEPHCWLEAFRSHPKIGEKKAAAETTKQSQQWSADEQSGVSHSAQQTLSDLAALNREYEKKFGYIFIVCATGKTSAEMLAILRERLHNDPQTELRIAAGEQAKITELRLQKLLGS